MTELENLRTENEELKARNSELEAKEKARQEIAINRGWWLTRFLTRISMGRNFETRARTALSNWSVWRPGKDIPREETINMFAAYLNSRLRMGILIAITAILGLVPTYFLWQQTVLMGQQTTTLENQDRKFEKQNEMLNRQNNFIAFEQTNRFRDLLKPDKEKMQEAERNEAGEIRYWPKPNMTRVEQLVILGETEFEITEKALRPLLQDENTTIAHGATLALLKIQKNKGVELDLTTARLAKANLEDAYLVNANLKYAYLEDANLFNAHLKYANLEDAYLVNANLRAANLFNASLEDANLEDASLYYANLEGAYLVNANLQAANLKYANLKYAYLEDANLKDAGLSNANLLNANLSLIKNWQHKNWEGTNIRRVKNAPDGFKEWALAYGAVEETSKEWYKRVYGIDK